MANPEHVALVRKGPEAIAKWRQAHLDERLDLASADLSNADLRGADLSDASLTGVNLTESDLSGVDFSRANLSWATLNSANLYNANFRLANLFMADLMEANLSSAYFSGANLNGAELFLADLSEAWLDSTSFGKVDLTGVKGIATVVHHTESIIGVDTLIASFRGAGNKLTPELAAFFRGAGVPQEVLGTLSAVVAEIKYFTCFISYGQPDLEFAKKLYEDLKARGVSCWLYEMDKTVGKRTRSEIGESRRGADRFVVLCSAAALVRDGVLEEIEDQISDDPDRLVPISLDNLWKEPGFRIMRGTHDLKPDLVNRNYADFANRPYEGALEELLKGLRRPAVKKPRRKKG
jgi:hypothetical protein